jgi:hypothetical protein
VLNTHRDPYRAIVAEAPDGETRAYLTIWSDGRTRLEVRESGSGRVLLDLDYDPHHPTGEGPRDAAFLRAEIPVYDAATNEELHT